MQNQLETLERFVDQEVVTIIRRSTIYKHVKKSKDREMFTDVSLGTVAGNVLCYLKNKYRKKYLFTQRMLCDIIVLACKKILIEDGIC